MNNHGRKYNVDDYFFDIETHEKYWLLGLLASDGAIGKYNQIILSQSGENGLKTINYVKKLISAECPTEHKETGYQIAHRIQFSSERIIKAVEKYNIVRNKTKTYTFPDIPEEFLSSFICGYVEGDGCITILNRPNDGYSYLHASFVGTKEFMTSCNNIIPIKGRLNKHYESDVYEIRWTGENAIKFCEWIYRYPYLFHNRKFDTFIEGRLLYINSKKERYKRIKNIVLEDSKKGINDIVQYSKDIDIPFQTVYKWRSIWMQQGII